MNILDQEILSFDREATVKKIVAGIRENLRRLRKRGLIIAISGGIDSSVSAALCVEAIGKDRVYGLLLPEHDSSSESISKGEVVAQHLAIKYEIKNIAPILEAAGCYQSRDEAMKRTIPEYESHWKSKIAISGGSEGLANYFNLVVQTPDGELREEKMALQEYLTVVAATNYKQRVRKMIEYFHADRLNYADIGTPNRLEYDQGFFVKNGDGAADIKPIAHLYKSQVYALGEHLGLPTDVCNSLPTTDTYSLPQGQDEFYFALDYKKMDVALWCYNNKKDSAFLARALEVDLNAAEYIYKDIENKRKTTAPLHWRALTIETVDGPIFAP